MKFTLASTLALATAALAMPAAEAEASLEKRNPSGAFSLYAWGVTSSAMKLFYSDGTYTPAPGIKAQADS